MNIIGYSLPFALLLSAGCAFYFLPGVAGKKRGYFLAFLFYWLFWCLGVPVLLIGKNGVADLFTISTPIFGRATIINCLLLSVPLIFVYSYEFPKVIKEATALIIVSSAALSIVNAIAEEILWRGTYFKLFGHQAVPYILFSSFGFAIWHFAPQIVFSNKQPGGPFSFVAVAFILGVFYSTFVTRTGNILPVIVSHFLFDFSGLGTRLYFHNYKKTATPFDNQKASSQ